MLLIFNPTPVKTTESHDALWAAGQLCEAHITKRWFKSANIYETMTCRGRSINFRWQTYFFVTLLEKRKKKLSKNWISKKKKTILLLDILKVSLWSDLSVPYNPNSTKWYEVPLNKKHQWEAVWLWIWSCDWFI